MSLHTLQPLDSDVSQIPSTVYFPWTNAVIQDTDQYNVSAVLHIMQNSDIIHLWATPKVVLCCKSPSLSSLLHLSAEACLAANALRVSTAFSGSDYSTSRICQCAWRQSYDPPTNTSMHTHFRWHLYVCLSYTCTFIHHTLARSYTVTHTQLSYIHISSDIRMRMRIGFRRIYNACAHTQTRWWISGFVPLHFTCLSLIKARCALFPAANTCWPPCCYPADPLWHSFTEPFAPRRWPNPCTLTAPKLSR